MSATITIHDQTIGGKRTGSLTLDVLIEHTTVRELIRSRVYQEVQDYNLKHPDIYRGLIEPADAERILNGCKPRTPRQIDWKAQFSKAIEAFGHNGFFILIDDHQAEDLDEAITLRHDTEINFVKLVPLVGG